MRNYIVLCLIISGCGPGQGPIQHLPDGYFALWFAGIKEEDLPDLTSETGIVVNVSNCVKQAEGGAYVCKATPMPDYRKSLTVSMGVRG